jgi:hypothetical protein
MAMMDERDYGDVLIGGIEKVEIRIVDYDPTWAMSETSQSACIALLDRGWGKPDKTHHHDGDIRQHIISDRPLTDDEWITKYCRG